MPEKIREARERVLCKKTMASRDTPGHIHTCVGEKDHDENNHFCTGCHRWWGLKGEK